MPRLFDGIDDLISCGVGATNVAFGTYAAIIDKTGGDAAAKTILAGMDTATVRWNLALDTSNRLVHRGVNSTLTITAAQDWQFIAVTKATGTVLPRAHRYLYATGAWTHENMSATVADSATTMTVVNIGAQVAGTQHFAGDIAVCGVWPVAMTDQQVEALAFSRLPWWAVSPNGVWFLDQAAVTMKVLDETGKGAGETARTGTAVGSTSAPFSYGHR